MRVLGIDLGSKRIGIAVSDRSGTIAGPLTVLQRSGDRSVDHRRIKALIEEEEAERLVVGMPFSLDGSIGRAAQGAMDEVTEMASVVGVPIDTWDERLTTVTADRTMIEAGMSAPARRKVVDKVAAAVMLQGWLDSQGERRRRESGTA